MLLARGARAADPYTEKINATPDYTQTDPAYGGFTGGGGTYCGPTAASNAVMWLANHGFPKLAPLTPDRKEDQYHVCATLGSSSYMNTDGASGTSPTAWCAGLENYIEDCGYAITRFEFQGWRYMTPPWDTGVNDPNLDWMRDGLQSPTGVVCWNVGWCKYDSATDVYAYQGAHYVTMVGHGVNASGPNPDYLVIHDPAPRTGMSYTNNYVLPVALTTGTVTGSSSGLPRSAAGLYKLTGWPISSKGNCAILNGAFVVELAPVTNFLPLATDDVYSVIQDGSITRLAESGFLANDTDANGDPFLPTIVSSPAHGALVTDYLGGFTYTPHADYFGMDGFTYTINDTLGDSNVATVTFSITPPAPGDANRDGHVDAEDAAALAANWLRADGVSWQSGDFNDDAVVDDLDLAILAANWQPGEETPAVPEPGTGVLLAGMAILLAGWIGAKASSRFRPCVFS
ncbi:MAG: cadherin-like domain-containing protein [Pirellulales bacterium]|nr:cadherin-like domain-containing protein [Pirellulales bacterium]